MKLVTTAGMLKAALDTVRPACEARSTIPVLGMVKFSPRMIEATNLDMTIAVTLPATVFRGELCLPFRPLAALIGRIEPDATVTIEGGTADRPNAASIRFGDSAYDVAALGVEDFPSIETGLMTPIKVDGDGLKKALAFVTPSMSTEETRYYLNGVYLDDTLAVATDGHRLAVHPLGFSLGAAKGIVPRPAVLAMLGMPPATNILIDPERMRFVVNAPGVTLTAKLIDGVYPDWRRVVPRFENDFQSLNIDRSRMRQVLARLGAFEQQMRAVTIAWQDDTLAAVVRGMDKGVFGRERMAIEPLAVGAAGRFTVNLPYFAAALRLLARETVDIRFNDRGSPIELRTGGEAFMIVMPMRGQDDTDAEAGAMLAEAAKRKLTTVPQEPVLDEVAA